MKIELTHYLNFEYPNGVEKTVKTWSLFGFILKTKIYNYPKLKTYDVVNSF